MNLYVVRLQQARLVTWASLGSLGMGLVRNTYLR